MRGNGLKFATGKVQAGFRENLRLVRLWKRLPRAVVESSSLEMFKKHGDVAMRDVVLWYGGDGLTVALDDLSGPSNLNDSTSLRALHCAAVCPWPSPRSIPAP